MLARGVVVSYETIRPWCAKFGQAYANQLRRRQARPGDKWHLDEVFIRDQRHDPLPVACGRPARQCARHPGPATPKRVGRQEVLPQTPQGPAYVPRVLITDRFTSYGSLTARSMPSVPAPESKYLNNRAENSHQPTRATRKGDETLHLARACATVPVCVQRHLATFSSPSASAVGGRLPTGDGRPLRGLERDHRGCHDRRLNVNWDRSLHQNLRTTRKRQTRITKPTN